MRFLFFSLLLCFMFSCQTSQMDYLFTIRTAYGDMKLILYDSTPVHKQNFLKLVQSKAYDSTLFHRVINQFMIQGGDMERKEGNTLDTEATLPAEFHKPYFHRKGAVAAARLGDGINPEKRSSAYQFYIVQGKIEDERTLTIDGRALRTHMGVFLADPAHQSMANKLDSLQKAGAYEDYTDYLYSLVPQIEEKLSLSLKKDTPTERIKAYSTVGGTPHLDDNYTVFGQVLEGFEVIDTIAALETHPGDSPKTPVKMSVVVEKVPAEELRTRYGLDEHMRLP